MVRVRANVQGKVAVADSNYSPPQVPLLGLVTTKFSSTISHQLLKHEPSSNKLDYKNCPVWLLMVALLFSVPCLTLAVHPVGSIVWENCIWM